MRKTVLLRMVPCCIGALLVSCGTAFDIGYHVSPSGKYDSLAEPVPDFSRCATVGSKYGCGKIQTTGNMARTDFLFKDLFVTCGVSGSGYQISMTNSIVADHSFKLVISLYGIKSPQLMYVCSGPVDDGSGGVTQGSCDVSALVHSTVVGSTPTNQCSVRFDMDTTPLSGSVECEFIDSGQNYLSIASGSVFQCQK